MSQISCSMVGARSRDLTHDRGYQAYQLLRVAFTVAPLVAGADKFFHLLTNWDQYLSPLVTRAVGGNGHAFMLGVGAIEIAAGLLVAFRPRIGGYVVAAWLWGIVLNLLLIPGYFDVAFRDFALSLAALALARISGVYEDRETP